MIPTVPIADVSGITMVEPQDVEERATTWRTDVARIWRRVYGGTRCDASAFEFASEIEAWARSTQPEDVQPWRPIETAPRDSRDMLLLFRPDAHVWGRVAPGMFNSDKYAKRPRPYWEIWLRIGSRTESRKWVPTHWMPLPTPPGAEPAPLKPEDVQPVALKPLTDEQIEAIVQGKYSPDISPADWCRDVARAIERAHSIGAEPAKGE